MEKRSRVVAITGASAGVGRATALEFARRGDDLALIARGRAGLEAARREVESYGVRALVLECDVADHHAVETAAERIEATLGEIDVWVNNAMASVFSPVELMRPEEFERVTRVTYLGTVHGTMAALKRMRPRNRGVIIQVGSALAYRSIPLQSAYCAAKHAIVGFTDSLRSELIHQESDVKLTAVHLPALNTPQFGWVRSRLPRKPQPVPPIYQPEIAAEAIEWASRNWRRELYVGLPTYKAILGHKVLPGYLDHLLARRAWEGQQHDGLAEPDRPDNLVRAVDEKRDYGAHGTFDSRSREASPTLWLSKNRGTVGLALAGAFLATAAAALAGGNRRELSRRATPVRGAATYRPRVPEAGG
ncbi:MAG TPA: SDR family oxidoreductase [Trueperaceae bacterium]